MGIHTQAGRMIYSCLRSGIFSGAVWRIVAKGRVVSTGSVGYAERTPSTRPMRMDTIFDLASLTKPICTGTLCLMMVESGQISLEEHPAEYLGELKPSWAREITIGQLLSHSSGLPAGIPLTKMCSKPGEILDAFSKIELAYEPGTRALYSDAGFILLGLLLESASGEGLAALFNKRVAICLGLKDTTFKPPLENKERIAATEVLQPGIALVGEVHDPNARFMGGVSGHAGLFSTVEDLEKFCWSLLGEGEELLSPSTVRMATRAVSRDDGNVFGLSWFKRRSPLNPAGRMMSPAAFGHTGYTGTSIWIDPERSAFVILLTNRVHPHDRKETLGPMNKLRADLHDLSVSQKDI